MRAENWNRKEISLVTISTKFVNTRGAAVCQEGWRHKQTNRKRWFWICFGSTCQLPVAATATYISYTAVRKAGTQARREKDRRWPVVWYKGTCARSRYHMVRYDTVKVLGVRCGLLKSYKFNGLDKAHAPQNEKPTPLRGITSLQPCTFAL